MSAESQFCVTRSTPSTSDSHACNTGSCALTPVSSTTGGQKDCSKFNKLLPLGSYEGALVKRDESAELATIAVFVVFFSQLLLLLSCSDLLMVALPDESTFDSLSGAGSTFTSASLASTCDFCSTSFASSSSTIPLISLMANSGFSMIQETARLGFHWCFCNAFIARRSSFPSTSPTTIRISLAVSFRCASLATCSTINLVLRSSSNFSICSLMASALAKRPCRSTSVSGANLSGNFLRNGS
mmetsp:Transcript_32212/g.63008  ORF Transcript_32212/g.63008 Transcript_32212/m.63008 type:complete len:242 (-) Transcript_32212:668-1393(-)